MSIFSENSLDHREFLFLLGSHRKGGNTELLAKKAAENLLPAVRQNWLNLADLPLPQFEDIRHHETRTYSVETRNEEVLLNATLSATDIVIASPVYWYSVSANTKHYLEYWSGWMRLPEIEFRERMVRKNLWVITVHSDEETTAGVQPLIDTLRFSADYMRMNWAGVLLGYGNRPGDVLNDQPSLESASKFFASL